MFRAEIWIIGPHVQDVEEYPTLIKGMWCDELFEKVRVFCEKKGLTIQSKAKAGDYFFYCYKKG